MKEQQLLYNIYEHGINYNEGCKILGISTNNYNRNKARELIFQYLQKNIEINDGNTHPIFLLHQKQVRELIELLQTESKGGKVNIFPSEPSIW